MRTQDKPEPLITTNRATTAIIAARHLSQEFRDRDGKSLSAIIDVSFEVAPAEFISIIGPSGSGKSTLLNVLAGLDAPTAGEVWLDGHLTTSRERLGTIGLMPQRDLLLPWRSTIENAIAGLEVQGVTRKEAIAHARPLLERFGLASFERAYPHTLSGGMRQRVALVRSALAAGPVLLLDEPFGALDALTRTDLRRWLLEAWQALGKTIILVTHDVDEALLLSDRVLVLSSHPGRLRATIDVPLPRPRDANTQASAPFGELRRQLLSALEVPV